MLTCRGEKLSMKFVLQEGPAWGNGDTAISVASIPSVCGKLKLVSINRLKRNDMIRKIRNKA